MGVFEILKEEGLATLRTKQKEAGQKRGELQEERLGEQEIPSPDLPTLAPSVQPPKETVAPRRRSPLTQLFAGR